MRLGIHIDENFVGAIATRILEGQIPYRDFYLHITSFSFYLSALFLKLFNYKILGLRIFILLISLGLVFVSTKITFILTKSKKASYLGGLIALIFGPVNFPMIPYSWLGALLIRLVAYTYLKFPLTKSISFFVIIGLLTSFSGMTSQNLTIIPIIVAVIGLKNNNSKIKSFLVYAFSAFVTGILLLIPHLTSLDLFLKRTLFDIIKIKKSSFIFPLTNEPLKSSILFLCLVAFGFFYRKYKNLFFIKFCLYLVGVLILLVSILKPEFMFDKYNWYMSIYVHNLLGISAFLFLILFLFKRTYFSTGMWVLLLTSYLNYFLNTLSGLDINYVLKSYSGIIFSFFIILYLKKYFEVIFLFICIGISIQISASPSSKFSNDVTVLSSLDRFQFIKMKDAAEIDFTSKKVCSDFLRDKQVYVLDDSSNLSWYEGFLSKAYWWYWDGSFVSDEINEGKLKEIESKKFEFFYLPRDVLRPLYEESFPEFFKAVDNLYEPLKGTPCENLYRLKDLNS